MEAYALEGNICNGANWFYPDHYKTEDIISYKNKWLQFVRQHKFA